MKLDASKIYAVIITHPNIMQVLETNFYSTKEEAYEDGRDAARDGYMVDIYHKGKLIAFATESGAGEGSLGTLAEA